MNNPQERPFLSIVIPVLNEEQRLPVALTKIDAFFKQQPYKAEVIIVENGSSDNTVKVALEFAEKFPYIHVFHGEPRGKGRAVRKGMLAAQGEYRFMCDVDLSMPIEEVANFLPPNLTDYDVAIGSREAKGAKRYDEPWVRHLMGRVNNLLIKLVVVRGFEDTQAGFKSLHYKAAEDIFSVSTMNGIGFDIEMLYIAQKRGYRIKEVPINWYYNDDSKMNLLKDPLAIIREMFEIHRNWRNGIYNKKTTSSGK
jgi:dolichyl-phosphate beta-glucosyltransferase